LDRGDPTQPYNLEEGVNHRLKAFPKSAGAAVLVAALFVSSCTQRSESGDTTAGSTVGAKITNPGDLPDDLTNMSATDLEDFARKIDSIVGTEQPRRCRGTPQCDAGTGRTMAQVQTFVGQEKLDLQNVGQHGTLVMRLRNTRPGGGREARYDLLPGAHVYYVIASKAQDGSLTWTMQELILSGPNPQKGRTMPGAWRECGEDHTPPANQLPQFWACPGIISATAAGRPSGRVGDPLTDPAWMTCSDGCCTAGDS